MRRALLFGRSAPRAARLRRFHPRAVCLTALLVATGCRGGKLPGPPPIDGFKVTILGNTPLGSPDKPLPFSMDTFKLTVDVEALKRGQRATGYDAYAVLLVRPVGTTDPEPLTIELRDGYAKAVPVGLKRVFGTVRLIVVENGYVPAQGTAACNNDLDDDNDGYFDSPGEHKDQEKQQGDRGCFYGNDDDERGGSGVAGASPPIYFAGPTIADVQRPIIGVGGDASPLKGERATITRGWLIVTRVGTDGMYVTDLTGARWDAAKQAWNVKPEELSFDSIYVYNYSAPLNLQEGDCLTQLDGQVDEFYGYTELGKPTWKKGDFAFCSAKAREAGLGDCPPANEDAESAAGKLCRERIEALANTPVDITKLMIDDGGTQRSVWESNPPMTERFEAGLVQLTGVTMFKEAPRCDLNLDSVIDYSNQAEKDCSNNCGDDASCIVWETYNRYKQWSVSFTDGDNKVREVNVVSAGGIQGFDPVALSKAAGKAGKVLSKVVGTLRNLSFGRPPWTIELRRPADCPDCKN
jgi:hypothetical protein